jgi:hypothetical protein
MLPVRISDEKLEAARLKSESRQQSAGSEEAIRRNLDRQEQFLFMFERTMSPQLSRRYAKVTIDEVRKWRDGWYDFGLRYNEIIEDWIGRVLSTSFNRAIGYVNVDDSSPSGFEEDALGNPVIAGGNDKLAAMILKAYFPEFKDKPSDTGTAANPLVINLA